ncbi:MAG: OprO/OprP family phosphate-selective porin [Bacteroidales bacterium]|jgi:hypothetical protein|nr:OprO/OprP family phosphate-selective porin [Bacteroidales bacterium]
MNTLFSKFIPFVSCSLWSVRKTIRILFFISFITLSPFLNAQEDTGGWDRISKIENIISKLPKMSGLVNLRYRYDDLNDANSFDIRRARLDLRGDISKQLGYRLHVEFANNPKILDAYVHWKINDYIALQTGQYKIPFSLENIYNPANLEMIDNSLVITALCGYSDVAGISANGRDIGIGFNGNLFRREGFNIINYSVGLFNGSGINTTDANKSKDFSGILTINPVKYLSLATYHYNGSTGAQENTFQRVRTGFGVKYDDGHWLARGEYIKAKTDDFKSEGAYAVLGCFVYPKIQILVKYDYFKRDLNNSDTRQQNYTAGINYLPVKNIRLQLNYTYATSPERDINSVAIQLMSTF